MKFVDGKETGEQCPKCGKDVIMYMGFTDQFSHTTGHYTTDSPMIVCSDDDCEYQEDYEEQYGDE